MYLLPLELIYRITENLGELDLAPKPCSQVTEEPVDPCRPWSQQLLPEQEAGKQLVEILNYASC